MIRLKLLAAAAARALSWPVDAAAFRGEWRRAALALAIVLLIALGAWVRQSQRPRRPHGRCGEESKAQIQRHGRSQSVHRTAIKKPKSRPFGLDNGLYFCGRCEKQVHHVDWEKLCESCAGGTYFVRK